MKTRSAKNKGRRLQNAIRDTILAKFTQLDETDVKVAIMGESGTDIKLSSQARKLFPYSVECKNVEKLNIWQAIEQAEQNTKLETDPLVVFSRNRMPEPYVAMKLSTFMKMVEKQNESTGTTQINS